MAIIGGGVLGASIAYFMAFLNPDRRMVLIEREDGPAQHASGRNTGKVHAPYLYDPEKKSNAARSALFGYDMWKEYALTHDMPFREDGVMEVATDPQQAKMLDRHHKWGVCNGLDEADLAILNARQAKRAEPEVRCHAALICRRDASVNYHTLTKQVVQDAAGAGMEFLPRHNVTDISYHNDGVNMTLNHSTAVKAGFVVNAAGGHSVNMAHRLGVAAEYADVYFRGEYWRAPDSYRNLTSQSIYSVPLNPRYPFLDPHWIVRVDGYCEVGPNAVPVFSPYGYTARHNMAHMLPKAAEMMTSGARRLMSNSEFRRLIATEIHSSVSKRHMIGRVARFMPRLNHSAFKTRGTAGIRTAVVDSAGSFVPDVMIREGPGSIHILNYNSPGATGALPFAVHIARLLASTGMYKSQLENAACGPWTFGDIPHI